MLSGCEVAVVRQKSCKACTPISYSKHEKSVEPCLHEDVQRWERPRRAQLARGSPHVHVSGSEVSLSRIISPVRPVDSPPQGGRPQSSCCCGYTLVSVQQTGRRANLPVYRVVGAHTCGRGVLHPGQRCKHHEGTTHFEVWQVRHAAAAQQQGSTAPSLHQAMLLHSCNTLHQLARFFNCQKLQVRP